MSVLDRLARAVAGNGVDDDPTRLTRRDLARRGGLLVFSLGALGQLGFPTRAAAAKKPCPTLGQCLDTATQAASHAFWACLRGRRKVPYDEFYSLDCRIWDGTRAARDVQRKCFTD